MHDENKIRIDRIIDINENKPELIKIRNQSLKERKELSKKIGELIKNNKKNEKNKINENNENNNNNNNNNINILKDKVYKLQNIIKENDLKIKLIENETKDLFDYIPNLLNNNVPYGKNENDNKIIKVWGNDIIKKRKEKLNNIKVPLHDDILKDLGLYHSNEASILSGTRFSIFSGDLARLERALISFLLDEHNKNGYEEVNVPFIVGKESLYGTGQLPKFNKDLFTTSHIINNDKSYLIPTGEVPLINLYKNKLLNSIELPIKLVASTSCFRAEAYMSAGRDVRGLMRQHQFNKVELIKITKPIESEKELNLLINNIESCIEKLKLPYRKLLLCSGDTGFTSNITYDIELWLPGQEKYREVSSCSSCSDFQSRRINIKYKSNLLNKNNKKKEKKIYCHTLNGSGLAIGRTLIAIIENYYQSDGTIKIPNVLRKYMNNQEKIVHINKELGNKIWKRF